MQEKKTIRSDGERGQKNAFDGSDHMNNQIFHFHRWELPTKIPTAGRGFVQCIAGWPFNRRLENSKVKRVVYILGCAIFKNSKPDRA